MNRLQTRIFGFFVLLLIAVQAFSFWMAYYSFNTLEKQQLDNRMSVAENVFHSEFDTRSHYLSIFAETVAKDFGLKETFIDGEQKSFLIALNNHRGRVKAEMAMAISKDGTVIGQLVSEATEAGKYKVKVGSEQGTKSALMLEKSIADFDSLYRLDGKVYQLRFATLTSGDSNTIGWIGFGFVVDSKLASIMEDQTGLPTGFALSSESTPPQFLAHSEIDIAPKVKTVLESFFKEGAENEDYLLWNQSLGKLGNESLYAYMYLPRADVLEALKKQWWRQFWLVLLMLPLSLFAAFGISGSITKPIMRLIEQAKFIAQGNYDAKVKPSSTLELAQLAHEFTEMQTAILSREQKIVHQAFHDTLTNLPNRNELERVVSEWVDGGSHVIICLLNIRRLTDVNVTLGHMVGDEVIKEVGHRLEKMSNVDIVCRLSGDEYAMALKDFDDVELSMLLQQVQLQMAKRYCYKDISLHLQLTMGVSILKSSIGLSELLQQANTAMQHAKANKLDFVIYDPKIDQHTLETFELVNALNSAIENNELVLFYQPKLCLEKSKVIQVEALVRWSHPQKGTIPPDVFIPIAEKTGQMNELSRWVLIEAIKQYHKWRSENIELSIAVNISAENLKDPEFCQWLLNTVEQMKMPVSALTLEITEDAVVEDPESAIMQLSHWRDHGLKLSIDDFGTGYSSLGQLKQLPVHEVKIDRSFIQHLMSNDEDKIIVNSTLELAHNLGLTVVAEGVEDVETLEWLTEHKCEMAQGFYLSRPIPADKLTQWLKTSSFEYIKSD